MKVITVIALIVSSCIGFSQEWNRDTANLIGPVKAVYYGSTEYVTDVTDYWRYFDTKTVFNRIGNWIYYSNFLEGKEFSTKIRVYDASTGRHIYDHSIYEGDTIDSWQMIYNKKGQIIKEIHLKDSKKDSLISFTKRSCSLANTIIKKAF